MHDKPDAERTDPRVLGWMAGFPPPLDKRVSMASDSRAFPRTRYTFSHMREMLPTRAVRRGPGPASMLSAAESGAIAEADVDALRFVDGTGVERRFDEAMALCYTDGIIVLHRGRVVYERYFGALDRVTPHLAMSVTKSFIGTLAAMLVHEREIDPARPVIHHIPELRESAWGDATVRQVMDMTTGLDYSEVYADPSATIWDYARACGSMRKPPDYRGPSSVDQFLLTVRKRGEHGEGFAYKTVNTEVLAWILRRVTGLSVAELMSRRLWQPLGAEEDAYFAVDEAGQETCGGGLNLTLRDLTRFGEALRAEGAFDGRQIIDPAVVDTIRRGGDRRLFESGGYPLLPGWSYANQWWLSHDAHGMFEARGIHGQRLHVDPHAQMTIARFGSHPIAANAGNDPYTHPAFRALARRLLEA